MTDIFTTRKRSEGTSLLRVKLRRASCPKHGTQPKNRAAFWLAKLTGNKARDRKVNRLLRSKGWTVMRIWEHELTKKNLPKLLKRLAPLAKK